MTTCCLFGIHAQKCGYCCHANDLKKTKSYSQIYLWLKQNQRDGPLFCDLFYQASLYPSPPHASDGYFLCQKQSSSDLSCLGFHLNANCLSNCYQWSFQGTKNLMHEFPVIFRNKDHWKTPKK
jgi:hypothetical protein